MKSKDLGTATITPWSPEGAESGFRVSTTGTWTIVYTVGRYGMDDGGDLIVVQRPNADAGRLQCEDPAAPNYVTAKTDGPAQLKVWFGPRYWIRPCKDAVVVRVYDGSLAPGDEVRITLGDRSGGSPGWTLQTFPETAHKFHVLVDPFGTREYVPIASAPAIRIVPGKPERIEAILPGIVRPSEPTPMKIRVMDLWHNPLDEFKGHVTVKSDEWEKTFEISAGVEEVGPVQFDRPGIQRLSVASGELTGVSNPVDVSQTAPKIFWADMHGQTEQTVGTGTVEEYYRFARDKGLIDAASWQGNDFQVTDDTWTEVCKQTKQFNQPGSFITFLGYEWSGLTPCGGDHNILYLHDDQSIHRTSHWQIHDGSSEASDRYPLSALWEEFKGRDDVMAIAHVGGRHANLDFWNDHFSGLIEVHSHHGTFEWILHEAIRRGLVFGVVGQSDDHSGRPGLSAPLRALSRDFATFDVFGGLTGIFADELSREALWDALRNRHCYATTGQRMLLDLRCGHARMGDVVQAPGPLDFTASVAGTAELLDVMLYRDSEILYRHRLCETSSEAWVRIEWSGVRIRSRNKKTEWPITLRVAGAEVETFRPYAFDQEGEGIVRAEKNLLEIQSSTSGDIDGVFLKLSSPAAKIHFDSPHLTQTVSAEELTVEPKRFPAGGVNLAVQFSTEQPDNRPKETSLSFRDESPLPSRCAYWLKAVQFDGQMAWSSPIFISV